MKRVYLFSISIFFIFHSFIFSRNILDDYFSNNIEIADAIELFQNAENSLEKIDSYDNLYETYLCNYIEASTIISTLYSSGKMNEYQDLVENLENDIEQKVNTIKKTSGLCIKYANFLYSEFFWKKNNSSIIKKLPVLYRQAIFLDKENNEALIKLALWYISASSYNTENWNVFIKSQESKLGSLQKNDLFFAYILYSMFYIKNYNTNKGLDYLAKAEKIYPSNILLSVIKENYSNGKIGW